MTAADTPADRATQALREASNDALLTLMCQLTHRIHDADGMWPPPVAGDLRAQRGMVRAELLRRLGGES